MGELVYLDDYRPKPKTFVERVDRIVRRSLLDDVGKGLSTTNGTEPDVDNCMCWLYLEPCEYCNNKYKDE